MALRTSAQVLEPDRAVDVVAKNRLAGIEISRQKTLDAFPEEFFAVLPVRLEPRLHRLLEFPRQRHLTSPASCASCSQPIARGLSRCRGLGAFSSRRRAR